MDQLLLDLFTKYPSLMGVFVVIGILRAVFKPLMAIAKAVVKETPSDADDKALDGFMNSRLYKALIWFVDYTTSIKLPTKKN